MAKLDDLFFGAQDEILGERDGGLTPAEAEAIRRASDDPPDDDEEVDEEVDDE